jgi:hypothetical protein
MYMQRSIKYEVDRYVITVKIYRPNNCNADRGSRSRGFDFLFIFRSEIAIY